MVQRPGENGDELGEGVIMAGLGCTCGHGMGTSADPSPYIVAVYYDYEVLNAIKEQNDLRLCDFKMEWDEVNNCEKIYMQRKDPVEYWYCPRCRRVHEIHIGLGHILRTYKRTLIERSLLDGAEKWRQVFVFLDMATYKATDEDWNITLKEFVEKWPFPCTFRLSPDERKAVAIDNKTGKPAFMYELEILWERKSECVGRDEWLARQML